MAARKNAAGLYCRRFRTPPNAAGKRVRIYVQCPREHNTTAMLDKLVRQAIDRHLNGVAVSRLTFEEFFETVFLPEYPASKDLAESSVDAYEYLIGDVACAHIGKTPIADIDVGTVARMVKKLREQSAIDAAVNKEEGRRARALQNQSQAPSVAQDFSPSDDTSPTDERADRHARVNKEEGRRARARALQNFGQGFSKSTIRSAAKVADNVLTWARAQALAPSVPFAICAEKFLSRRKVDHRYRSLWTEPGAAEVDRRISADERRDAELKASTTLVYRYHLRRHLVPHLGQTPIGKVTSAKLEEVYQLLRTEGKQRAIYVEGALKRNGTLKKPWELRRDERRGGTAGQRDARFSPQTIRNLVINLKAVMGYAKERGHISSIPEIVIPKVPKARTPPPYTRDEARRLIEAAETEDRRVLYVLSYDAGCRKSELLGLHWEQVIWDRHVIKFDRQRYRGKLKHCKGGKEREVPMSPPLEKALKRLYLKSENKKGPVFTRADGQPLEEHHLRTWHERDTEKAGLRKVRWHSKRHTFSTLATERGVTPWGLQLLLGHADIRTTQTYVHASSDRMASVLDDEATS